MTLLPAKALDRVRERLQTASGWPTEVYTNRGRLSVWQTVVTAASGRVIANLLHDDPEELAELITHKSRQVEFQQAAVIEFLARHDDDDAREAMIQEAMGNVLNGIAPKDETGARDYRLGGMVDMLDIEAVTRAGVAVDGSPGVSGFRFRITLLMTAESLLGENLNERVTAVVEPILMSGSAEVLRGNLLAAEVDPILSAATAAALAQIAGAPGVDDILGTGEADIQLSGNAAGVIDEILGSGAGELRLGVAAAGVIEAILGSGSVTVPQSGTNGAMDVAPILGVGAAQALLDASAAANVEAILGTGAIAAGSGAGLNGWVDPILGSGQTDLLISGISGSGLDPILGSGGVAIALSAQGGGNVEAILSSGQAGQPVNTANGGGAVDPILSTGLADALVSANGAGTLDPILGSGDTDLLIAGASAGVVEAVLGSGAGVIALTANSAGVLDPIISTSSIAVDVNATGAGLVDPIIGSGAAAAASGLNGAPTVDPILSASDAAVLAAANGAPSVAPILGSGAGAALIQGQSVGGSVMSILGTGAGIVAGGGGNEAETDALLARMVVAPDATLEGHINTCIAAIKAAGAWAKLDGLFLPCLHTEQASLLEWKNAFADGVLTGGAVWQQFKGIPIAGNQGMTTGFNFASLTQFDAVNRSGHWGGVIHTPNSGSDSRDLRDGTNTTNNRSDNGQARLFGGENYVWTPTTTEAAVFAVSASAALSEERAFVNGTQTGSDATPGGTSASGTLDIGRGAYGANSGTNDAIYAGLFVGAHLTQAEGEGLTAAIKTLADNVLVYP